MFIRVIFTTNLVWALMIMFATPGLKYINALPTIALVSVMMNRITMNLRTTFHGEITLSTMFKGSSFPVFRRGTHSPRQPHLVDNTNATTASFEMSRVHFDREHDRADTENEIEGVAAVV